MILGKTISVIIPCRNEEKAIAAMLRKMPSYVDEVIVVDNGSRDKTAVIARKLGAIVLTEHREANGIGYGYAHQRGMKAATSDYLITMDGDNTYPLRSIKKVITYMIKAKLDFVSCNRFPLANRHAISWLRQLGVWILNKEVQLLYNYPIQDLLSGMWAMSSSTAGKLKPKCGGWNLSPEIKLVALQQVSRFAEFHIDHAHRDDGQSKQQIWKTGFSHLSYIAYRRFVIDNKMFTLYQKSLAQFALSINS